MTNIDQNLLDYAVQKGYVTGARPAEKISYRLPFYSAYLYLKEANAAKNPTSKSMLRTFAKAEAGKWIGRTLIGLGALTMLVAGILGWAHGAPSQTLDAMTYAGAGAVVLGLGVSYGIVPKWYDGKRRAVQKAYNQERLPAPREYPPERESEDDELTSLLRATETRDLEVDGTSSG